MERRQVPAGLARAARVALGAAAVHARFELEVFGLPGLSVRRLGQNRETAAEIRT